jgi:hypothetical protein
MAGVAVAENSGMTIFLGEKIGLVPAVPEVDEAVLPAVAVRVEQDEKALVLVVDCDARNLNPPGGTAPPYRLGLELGDGETGRVRLEMAGTREPEGGKLTVVASAPGGQTKLDGWEDVEGVQSNRQDGTTRVETVIPRALLEKHQWVNGMGIGVEWRKISGYGEGGEGVYDQRAGRNLAGADGGIRLEPREMQPADVTALLETLEKAPDGWCGERCLRRIIRVCTKNEGLRGALVMAMDHAEPAVRQAAARVWLAWPDGESVPDLDKLREKARSLQAKPEP